MQATESDNAKPVEVSTDPDLSWSELLAAFRRGPKEQWSGTLLDRLGPWLTNARKTLVAAPPSIDAEDVEQQLVLEVLHVAARWRPGCEDRWIPRKLVEAAARRVRKSLKRVRSSQWLELDDEFPAPDVAEPDLVFDTPIGQASTDELRVIYRFEVLGEPLEALAREHGLTPRQMRRRLQVARKRARA